MINDYAANEHKIFSSKAVLNIKAKDNKDKIATIQLEFAPVIDNPNSKGKSGNWSQGVDFQLSDSNELIDFSYLLVGRKTEVVFPYHNSKKLTVRRNQDGSLFFSINAPSKNFSVIAADTDQLHILILTCKAIANQYHLSEGEALNFIRSVPFYGRPSNQ